MAQQKPIKLTRGDLIEEAGNVYFARGKDYFERDYVHALRERDNIIRATVEGSQVYKTAISITDDEITGKCSCPLGEKGEFCEHLVATGLAYIESQKTGEKTTKKKAKPITPRVIESYLSELDTPELVDIIMKQADIDDDFYAMLKMRVAAEKAGSDTSEIRDVLREAMTIRDFISWRDTGSYIHSIDRVLDQIRTLLTPKQAAQVIDVAEYGMDLWEENIGLIDDSNGCMGMLRDELQDLHIEACNIARPDPVDLAERLAHRCIDSGWDMFYGAYESYFDILRDVGRARYREIFETEWDALPALGAGQEDSDKQYGRVSALKHTMLEFAEKENDLNLAIRVLSRDLSHPYEYLRIANHCRNARKRKLAIEWAEKGVAAFADKSSSELRSFLAEEYLHAKRPDDAMAMIWTNFKSSPTLESYKDLAGYARKLKCWDQWREKALTHIRADIDKCKAEFEREYGANNSQKRKRLPYWQQAPDHTLLVCIFLWEKREEDAWNEATNGGCDNYRWLDLAKVREKNHPEDAIGIYRRQVVPLIETTTNSSYQEAVEFIKKIHGLMNDLGKREDFHTWLSELKKEYKRKRNFIKYVNELKIDNG